jgi:PilZ domain-containing protein
MGGRKGWLEKMLVPYRADRRAASGFIAYRLRGAKVDENPVRDISATGAFVVTGERPVLGSLFLLTMQQNGPFEVNRARRITTFARVVRHDEDGIGVEFVAPSDEEEGRWVALIDSLAEQTNPSEMVTFLRISHAIVFLSRITEGSTDEFNQLFRGRLSSHKIANAMAIALRAEALLSAVPEFERLRGDPSVLCRILEVGGCADEEWLQNEWAGLLAVCCKVDGSTDADLEFVNLLSQLTAPQIRILSLICARTSKQRGEGGALKAAPAAFGTEELAFGICLREAQIERDLEILSDIGLLTKEFHDSRALLLSDSVDLAPTPLAMELFSRCRGHRGALEEFYT